MLLRQLPPNITIIGGGHTYHDGARIDTIYLHMKEWLQYIRSGK